MGEIAKIRIAASTIPYLCSAPLQTSLQRRDIRRAGSTRRSNQERTANDFDKTSEFAREVRDSFGLQAVDPVRPTDQNSD